MILEVFCAGQYAGRLKFDGDTVVGPHTTDVNCSFEYDSGYLESSVSVPLSLQAPLTDKKWQGVNLANWLAGLLPQMFSFDSTRVDWNVRLLKPPTGLDCAGAVQFCSVKQPDRIHSLSKGRHSVTDEQIDEHFRYLHVGSSSGAWPTKPKAGYVLTGMQPKIAVAREKNGWAIPWGAQPSTHIIKKCRDFRFPHETTIEHLTMRTAERLGLPVADTNLATIGEHELIVVERFDRRPNAASSEDRIHQEDMCQALGYNSADKYHHRGGPSPKAMAGGLRQADPADFEPSVLRFADLLLFQWATASTDGHAKNFSIQYPAGSGACLSPGYDIASWTPYGGSPPDEESQRAWTARRLSDDYATACETPVEEQLIKFAEDLEVPSHTVVEHAERIAQEMPDALASAIDGTPTEFTSNEQVERYVTEIEAMSRWTSRATQAAAEMLSSAPA